MILILRKYINYFYYMQNILINYFIKYANIIKITKI